MVNNDKQKTDISEENQQKTKKKEKNENKKEKKKKENQPTYRSGEPNYEVS